jgi:hypothetical protein
VTAGRVFRTLGANSKRRLFLRRPRLHRVFTAVVDGR